VPKLFKLHKLLKQKPKDMESPSNTIMLTMDYSELNPLNKT